MTECTINAIYLRPNDNTQGGHICMNLNTGKCITHGHVTTLPLSTLVKQCVEEMVHKQGINLHCKIRRKKCILPFYALHQANPVIAHFMS